MDVTWARESDKYSVNTESRPGCIQYSCAESSNISKFVCRIIKVCVRNHQDNYFLINVAYRSDANLINGHGSIFQR